MLVKGMDVYWCEFHAGDYGACTSFQRGVATDSLLTPSSMIDYDHATLD